VTPGGTQSRESYVEFEITLEDVNDNAPFLNMPDGLVWPENSPPGTYTYLSIYLSVYLSIVLISIVLSIYLLDALGIFIHKKKKLTKSKLIYFFYSSCYPSVSRSLGIYSFLFHLNVRVRHQISQVRRQLCLYLGLFYLSICVSVFYLSI
jgi:hypothetical protein